jgi:hypothetical protein
MPGILDWLGLGNSSPQGGVLGPMQPAQQVPQQPPLDRLGIIGATLQDAAANFGGHQDQATHLDPFLRRQKQQTAMAKFQAAKTPEDLRAAALELYAAGGDPAALGAVMKMGQPTYTNTPEADNVYSTDPITGVRTLVTAGKPKAPTSRTIQSGANNITQEFDPNTGTWNQVSSGPRFKPAAPPKPAATGVIKIPHPGSMY